MALTSRNRTILYQYFTQTIQDPEAVEQMLSYFPSRDVEEPITREYLDARLAELQLEMDRRMEDRLALQWSAIEARFDQIDARFSQVDKRHDELVQTMNTRFDQIDKRHDELIQTMNTRFGLVDKRFGLVDKRFDQIDKRHDELVQTMNTRFKSVDERFDRLEDRLGKLEARVSKVETGLSDLRSEMNQGFRSLQRWTIGSIATASVAIVTISRWAGGI